MEQLIRQLQERAGLSPEQAEKATSVFADFLSNSVSDDQVRAIAEKIPGLSAYSDKIPSNIGDTLGGFARNLMNRGE